MNYDEDIYEEMQGRPLGPMEWTCNCNCILTERDPKFTKMHRTKVDSEGICLSCGHYALKLEVSILDAKRAVLKHVRRAK